MLRKKNQCRTCKTIILTDESRLVGKCFYCRNYAKIERNRINEWEKLYEDMEKMPDIKKFQRYEKRMIRDGLLYGKRNFIKSGYMGKEYKVNKRERDMIEKVAIMVAVKNPQYEKRIVWSK